MKSTQREDATSLQINLRIEAILRDQSMSKNELARRSGIDRRRLPRLVRGEWDIRLSTAAKLAVALDVTLDELCEIKRVA